MITAADRKLRAEQHEALTNPMYAVEVQYVPAHDARSIGIPVAPELPDDALIGVLNHEVAWDPKYGRDDED